MYKILMVVFLLVVVYLVFVGLFMLQLIDMIEWKVVYGQVEVKDMVFVCVCIGGVIIEFVVIEGDVVKVGQKIVVVCDDKIDFQFVVYDV